VSCKATGQMEYSAYTLFGLEHNSTPREVLNKCIAVIDKWKIEDITFQLLQAMPREQAMVNAKQLYDEGQYYLKTTASMLMDPSARQCYDAWLEVMGGVPSPEKRALTKARFIWFNQQCNAVKFSKAMMKCLGDQMSTVAKAPPPKKMKTKPICRQCRCAFDFNEPYLVLHCHCTTRVGHNECLDQFHKQCNGKCPVCRQPLLMRYQISKYLFWNVKDKFKLIL